MGKQMGWASPRKTYWIVLTIALCLPGCSGNGSGATNTPGTASADDPGEPLPPLQPDKKESVAAMIRQGVNIGYDEAGRVIRLDFSVTKATNPWLKQLEGLPNVARIDLRNTNVTDAGMQHLSGLHRLAELRLPESITNTGLASLKTCRGLQELYLEKSGVTGEGLVVVESLPRLRAISLANTQVTDDGLTHLTGLKQLEWINLSGTQVTNRGLSRLQGLTKLKTLNLFLLPGITDDAIGTLSSMPQLAQLDLGFTGMTEEGISRLKKALPTAKVSN